MNNKTNPSIKQESTNTRLGTTTQGRAPHGRASKSEPHSLSYPARVAHREVPVENHTIRRVNVKQEPAIKQEPTFKQEPTVKQEPDIKQELNVQQDPRKKENSQVCQDAYSNSRSDSQDLFNKFIQTPTRSTYPDSSPTIPETPQVISLAYNLELSLTFLGNISTLQRTKCSR